MSIDNIRLLKVLNLISKIKPKKVLDIGCGDGYFSNIIQKYSDEVYGIDISSKSVLIAKKRGIKASTLNLNEEKFPYENEFFDLLFGGEIIEHLYDCENFIKECSRVLKKNGHIIITTPNLASWYNRFLLLLGYQPMFSDVGKHQFGKFNIRSGSDLELPREIHLHIFTLKAINELLEAEGFKIVRAYGAPVTSVLPSFLLFVDKIMSYKPSLSSHLIIHGKKIV